MRLFEAGPLLTFSAFRIGAYSRWVLIQGWALIRINTVNYNNCNLLNAMIIFKIQVMIRNVFLFLKG